MEQKTHLKLVVFSLFLYMGINFLHPGHFFTTEFVLWITVYFLMGYIRRYLPVVQSSRKLNGALILLGCLGSAAMVVLTNLLGLRISAFSSKLLDWGTSANPFLLMIAMGSFQMMRSVHFQSGFINRMAGLSLLVYLFHENLLLRTYYRPLLWQTVYSRFGYESIVWLVLGMSVGIALFSFAFSLCYRHTFQRMTAWLAQQLLPRLQKLWQKAEDRLLRLQ